MTATTAHGAPFTIEDHDAMAAALTSDHAEIRCQARASASWMHALQDWLHAEQDRGTSPTTLMTTLAIMHAQIYASVVAASARPAGDLPAQQLYVTIFTDAFAPHCETVREAIKRRAS